jgi:hypothetical protein
LKSRRAKPPKWSRDQQWVVVGGAVFLQHFSLSPIACATPISLHAKTRIAEHQIITCVKQPSNIITRNALRIVVYEQSPANCFLFEPPGALSHQKQYASISIATNFKARINYAKLHRDPSRAISANYFQWSTLNKSSCGARGSKFRRTQNMDHL